METLINRNADVSVRTDDGRTVLVTAAMNREESMFQLLLAIPAIAALVNARGGNGWTALVYAVVRNYASYVDALLAAGADPNTVDNEGSTPLMMCFDVEIAKRLIDGGANVAASSNGGFTALMIATAMLNFDMMKLLLSAPGVPPGYIDAQDRGGITALIHASTSGSTASVEALIAAGADVHLARASGHTALHLASNVDIARLLWNAGGRDSIANDGDNILATACKRNKPDVVEFLLQRGLDINQVHQGKTALMRTVAQGHVDVLRVLLAADPPVDLDWQSAGGYTALFIAILVGNKPEIVRMLLAHGASVDIFGDDRLSILMIAVTTGKLEMVNELLQVQSPTLLNARGHDGQVALHLAVDKNYLLIVDALIAAGADPNIASDDGYTPLMTSRSAEMSRRLIDGGADVNACRPDGTTVLMFTPTMDNGDISLAALLIERGADDHCHWLASGHKPAEYERTNSVVLGCSRKSPDGNKMSP
jgi:ankyrin repeat protein